MFLAFYIYVTLKVFGINLNQPDTYPQINENQQFSLIKPQSNNCRMIEDTKSLIPNHKYTCN